MDELSALARLLAGSGPWSYAYIDGHTDHPEPEEEARRRAVRDRLEQTTAGAADVGALAEALAQDAGLPSPSARYLLIRDGRVELDARFLGPRHGPERIGHTQIPPILPLLRHVQQDKPYLVVEVARAGARLRAGRTHRAGAMAEDRIEGRSDTLSKVPGGGRAQGRYQMRTEEIWKENQAEVAERVEELVSEVRPAFIVVAGDVRARQLLIDALGAATRELVIDVDANTTAPGAADGAIDEAVDQATSRDLENEFAAARARAEANGGSNGAHGTDGVLRALQQARVETLVMDARWLATEDDVLAFDGPPWVGRDASDAAGTAHAYPMPVAEGLARAAVLTGARVVITGKEPAAGEPLPDRAAVPPVAPLR